MAAEELVHESEARHRPEGVLTVSELGGELASCRVEAHGGLRPESTRVAATEEYSINSTGGNPNHDPNVRLEPTCRLADANDTAAGERNIKVNRTARKKAKACPHPLYSPNPGPARTSESAQHYTLSIEHVRLP